eukprot:NODE_4260_length_483_cov_67.783410_g3655_i0.p1 GENE.NODE_4260_length_483_cov_67.783410_g3655_i0~~NODE_4260_length_483_cov_67.783410_g3655_i0.p1  ORF type:complete len:97 (-),score=30.21 NODE_4260_length_483_cov_67.783410_g3655_i0:164-454(-)
MGKEDRAWKVGGDWKLDADTHAKVVEVCQLHSDLALEIGDLPLLSQSCRTLLNTVKGGAEHLEKLAGHTTVMNMVQVVEDAQTAIVKANKEKASPT